MVTIRYAPPAEADFDRWLKSLEPAWQAERQDMLQAAYSDAQRALPGSRNGLEAADLLARLGLDADSVAAALLHEAFEKGKIELAEIRGSHGESIADLVHSATYLHQTGNLQQHVRSAEQIENLRKMLLAMAADIRVVLIMLAIRLCMMRNTANLAAAESDRAARETLEIFAPLANRLGIGQMKWELEDLALRALEPRVYKNLAAAIDERRSDRESYIEQVVDRLQIALRESGIEAEVTGRAKHIYSIWHKMRRKHLQFDQLFDVRALRIMVRSVNQCYAALGVVHALWKNIGQEFDDYIANPKSNGYQSLHTAVIGPEGRTLEVQIRTDDMHRHAELGVAAHWRYKEGSGYDQTLEQQVSWFRHMLDPQESDAGELLDQLKSDVVADRVYVRTPKGDIVDLPLGATPLDFAYSIHTEIGHRCRGAKINGRIVTLQYHLQSGDQVDVLTVKQGSPSRDWLSPHLGYLHTSRARGKVRHWFRLRDRDKNIAAGRLALEQEFRRLSISFKSIDLDLVAERFNMHRSDELLAALGGGELTTTSVAATIQDLVLPTAPEPSLPIRRKRRSGSGREPIRIRGIGNLLTQIAQCCQPVPPEPIAGYITHGRGVTIHRQDCANMLDLRSRNPERYIEVDWGDESNAVYAVDVQLEAHDREGLLRDITTVLANEKVNVLAVNTRSDTKTNLAKMELTFEIASLEQLSRALDKLGRLPNVLRVHRKR